MAVRDAVTEAGSRHVATGRGRADGACRGQAGVWEAREGVREEPGHELDLVGGADWKAEWEWRVGWWGRLCSRLEQ